MSRYLALAVFAAAPFSVFVTACTKVAPVPDAGIIVVDATAAVDPDAAAAVATDDDAGVAPATPLATTGTPHTVATTHTTTATGGAFQGSFGCQMSATQTGNAVSGTMKGSSFNCNASGDICDGRINVKTGGKTENRHFTLKRNGAGDLTYHGDGEPQPTFCKKQ